MRAIWFIALSRVSYKYRDAVLKNSNEHYSEVPLDAPCNKNNSGGISYSSKLVGGLLDKCANIANGDLFCIA